MGEKEVDPMPRIRCRYVDCVFLENGYCGAVRVEIDPDEGCLTYSRLDEETPLDEAWEEEEEIDEIWDDEDELFTEDDEGDDEIWLTDDEL